MSRGAGLLLSLLLASAAHAAWFPVFNPSYVQVRPGDRVSVRVHGAWLSGVTAVPFTPMIFAAEDPTVATVDGSLLTAAGSVVYVTAHRPGVTRLRVLDRDGGPISSTSPVIVVAEGELPVAIRVGGVLRRGSRITLSAVSDEPDATFTWYWGRLNGLYTWEVGRGRELTFVPTASVPYEYWVLVSSPNGAGAAGVVVGVLEPPGRRRGVRH